MGIFDRIATLFKSNINDLISKAENPGEDARPDPGRHAQPARAGQAAGGQLDRRRKAPQGPGRRRVQGAPGLGGEGDARGEAGARRPRQAGAAPSHARACSTRTSSKRPGRCSRRRSRSSRTRCATSTTRSKKPSARRTCCSRASARAQAQQRIAETMSGMSEKSAFEAFARMEERIANNERQIKASVEIDEEFSGDRLQSDFKKLERVAGSASADQQLDGAQGEDGAAAAGQFIARAASSAPVKRS